MAIRGGEKWFISCISMVSYMAVGGGRKYMKELIADWLHCDMYGKEQAVFKVVKVFPSE